MDRQRLGRDIRKFCNTKQDMRTIYYVVSPQLESIDNIQECNGWKDISLYEVEDGTMVSIGFFTMLMEEETYKEVSTYLEEDYSLDLSKIRLIQL